MDQLDESINEGSREEKEAKAIFQDLKDERGGIGELHGMSMEDALDTVETYGWKDSRQQKIAKELFALCNESEQHDTMAYGQLENIIDNANELRRRFETGHTFDAWMHGKILKAKDYLSSVHDVIDGGDGTIESYSITEDESNEYFVSEEKEQSNDKSAISGKGIETGLKNKAKETGVPIGILRVIMRRGMAAWKTGHRPGATQVQWGYARVNSFLTKGDGTWGKADKDMAKEVRDGGHDKKL